MNQLPVLNLQEAQAELNTRTPKAFISTSQRYTHWPDIVMGHAYSLQKIKDTTQRSDFLYAGLIAYTSRNVLLEYFPTSGPRDFVIDQLKIGVRIISHHWDDKSEKPYLDMRVATMTNQEDIAQTKQFLEGFHRAVTGKELSETYWPR